MEGGVKMSKVRTVIGTDLPNIPWEDRPHGCSDPVWRYSKNPVIPRDLIPTSNSIFNSAVLPFNNKFVGVFRCDDKRRRMQLHYGESDDGFNWRITPDPIVFQGVPPRSPPLTTAAMILASAGLRTGIISLGVTVMKVIPPLVWLIHMISKTFSNWRMLFTI